MVNIDHTELNDIDPQLDLRSTNRPCLPLTLRKKALQVECAARYDDVAVSSVSLDRGAKLRTYERHGVREYLIWRVEDKLLEWYVLRDDGFELQQLPGDGIYRSETFPGLWLDASAMLQRDGKSVMRVLNEGLATSEHAAFVTRLETRRNSG